MYKFLPRDSRIGISPKNFDAIFRLISDVNEKDSCQKMGLGLSHLRRSLRTEEIAGLHFPREKEWFLLYVAQLIHKIY